jgi:hypothetical protein
MYLDYYTIERKSGQLDHMFYSEGPKGRILKAVSFRRIREYPGQVFNLSFGDWDEKNKRLDDKAISNNSDRLRILSTVAMTLVDFTHNFPNSFVYAEGATTSRTRLYQMSIAAFHAEICERFHIYGVKDGILEPFEKGINYDAFMAKRK